MNNLFNYFRLLLLSMSGALLLCIIFAINPELAHGILMGRLCWFHFAMLLFAGSILFMELTVRKSRFVFSLPDGLLLLLFGIILISYDQASNLDPERFIFIAQLTVLWFMLRAALQVHQELRVFFITIIMFTSTVVGLWGIWDLNNALPPTHPVFKMLKESINPEPFDGYIAVTLPICLNMALRLKGCNKLTWWKTRTFLYYLATISTITICIALSFETNHSIWVAGIISCIWVCWMRLIGWNKTKERIKQHNKLFAISSIVLFFIIAGVAMLGNISRASAGDRNLLVWNVTTKAIMEHPLTGTGLGGFRTTFAQAQAAYFASDIASEEEKAAATCPEYAYNEYLQMGLESGITGLLFFALWLAFSLYYGIKHKRIGASGGIVSLAIFALYSYPLQMPTFWVLLVFFTAICVTNPKQEPESAQSNMPYIGALAALVSCILFCEQRDSHAIYKEWKAVKELYVNKTYDLAATKYCRLYIPLCHRTDFLIEGADCLSKVGKQDIAIIWLKRAMQLSADPDIYYAMARNKEAIGEYKKAENYLLDAIHLLPKRGYAYIMLIRLYAQPSFYQPDKLRLTADRLLELTPIKQSGVTPEMEKEVHLILNKRGLETE